MLKSAGRGVDTEPGEVRHYPEELSGQCSNIQDAGLRVDRNGGSVSEMAQGKMFGDPPLADIAEEVQQARAAILAQLKEHPGREWRPREMIAAAKGDLPNTVVSIAFWNLVDAGDLAVDERLVVRVAHLV